jgi:hypothetical protein
VTLAPGEEEIHSIELTNNLDRNVSVNLTVEGFVWELIQLEKTSLIIKPRSTEVVKVKVYTLPSTMPGIYTGDIVVSMDDTIHRIPVTVKVEIPAIPLLDVKVESLTKVVRPGDEFKFRVTAINMGETTKIEDIVLNYTIKSLKEETVILRLQETIAVETVKSFTRMVKLPENIVPDKTYIIEALATYWYGNKTASAVDTFDVSALPLALLILRAIFLNPLTYAILFGVIPGSYFGIKAYTTYRERKIRAARYIFPVDFKKLPRAGPKSIPVGKIAETDVKAYFDMNQLIMHSLAAGGTGSGKSVSAMVVSEELLAKGIPVIVFDPTAQWTGFIRPCKDTHMLELYPRFGLKPGDARSYKTNIILVEDPEMKVDIKKYMKPGEITVFVMTLLSPKDLDTFVRRTIQSVFDMRPPESKEIKLLLVYDEVHRLLPKYGGKGGYVALERGCREFRKWGIGLFMISQVLQDFRGAIRANIATEIQLRTKYEGDLNRVKTKYGSDYASRVVKLMVGNALVQNPEYNDGKPWFVNFRPLLHSTFALTPKELSAYNKVSKQIEKAEKKIETLKARGVDTYDVEIELNIARDKMKQGMFKMAETYLESVNARLRLLGR